MEWLREVGMDVEVFIKCVDNWLVWSLFESVIINKIKQKMQRVKAHNLRKKEDDKQLIEELTKHRVSWLAISWRVEIEKRLQLVLRSLLFPVG